MTYLSDRQRREIAILPRILLSVCRQDGALVEDGDEGSIARLRKALDAVNEEAFAGLMPKEADKAERQIVRATKAVILRSGLEGQPNAKIVAAVWEVMEHLIASGDLVLYEGTPMAEAVAILGPAHAHVYDSPRLAKSAEKTARRLFQAMQAEGLWTRAAYFKVAA
jgi:hypothetical protein